MEILPRISESCPIKKECDHKMNSNVYPLKNTNSHYLLIITTIIPLCNGKISLIFL